MLIFFDPAPKYISFVISHVIACVANRCFFSKYMYLCIYTLLTIGTCALRKFLFVVECKYCNCRENLIFTIYQALMKPILLNWLDWNMVNKPEIGRVGTTRSESMTAYSHDCTNWRRSNACGSCKTLSVYLYILVLLPPWVLVTLLV